MDTRSVDQRRRIMQSVGRKDTGPEITVRRVLHALGFRFRLHRQDLPGRPDIVFPSRRKVIFVHGCFWHGHNCRKGRLPKSRIEYWGPKIEANRERDARTEAALAEIGFDVEIIWQCETVDASELSERLKKFLDS
ncbi:very short patch repair endonuclease [Mesorhizobium sp.]|uniref:very short patch repair endonuclease n=1 Tax=Mesorhizobium sp. TaxID=1871066 RepID=UPI000FE993AF|nr:very short patch repair endonuclease [Mesorhizobium sp.]RWO57074.1 MAG: DNA mismatch endonuclease Vsr [Mesorhizobium sp.]